MKGLRTAFAHSSCQPIDTKTMLTKSIDYLSFNDLQVLRNKLHPSTVGPNELSPSAKLLKNHVFEKFTIKFPFLVN